MMKTVKTILLATTLATFGSSAFAEFFYSDEAEEIIVDGRIINSILENGESRLLVEHRSKLYLCSIEVFIGNETLFISCYSR